MNRSTPFLLAAGLALAAAPALAQKDPKDTAPALQKPAGTDIYSKSQNIPTSNKLWLGLSFGYNFE